jgi:hypothetical protein
MKFKLLIILLALLTTPSLFASFYRGSIWSRVDEQGQEHFVYCLGDAHSSFCDYQRQQLSRVFKRIDVTNTLAIVEDMSSLLGQDWYKTPEPDNYQSVLANITEFFQEHSIQPINVEFRNYFHDTKNYWKNREKHFDLYEFLSLLKQYISRADSALLEANIHNENSTLNNLYAQSRNTMNQHIDALRHMMLSINPKDNTVTIKGTFQLMLIEMTVKIIDLRILSTLVQNNNKKHTFICAGGGHIENIEQVLPRLGYREIQSERYLLTSPIFVLHNFSGSFTALNLDRMFDEFFTNYPQALASTTKHDQTPSLGVAASLVATSLNAGGPFTQESEEQDRSPQSKTHYQQPKSKKTAQTQLFKRKFSTAPRMVLSTPTQPVPMAGKTFVSRVPKPTFTLHRFTSRPFRFAALGLAGISAVGAYAWFGR